MFDLENAIENWKRTFRADGSLGAEGMEEIETHLRESIEHLKKSGLDGHEAFAVSVHRLGSSVDLEAEFAKNRPVSAWRFRLAWMLGGFLVFELCSKGAWASSGIVSAGMAYGGVASNIAGPTALTVLAISWIGLLALSCKTLLIRWSDDSRFTLTWAVLVACALYGLTVTQGYAQLAQTSFGSLAWYEETTLWIGYGSFVLRVVGVIACLAMLRSFSKPLPTVVQ